MLVDITNEVNSRIREARQYLDLLRSAVPDPPAPATPGGTAAKGLFFVALYSIVEFTVHSAMQRVLQRVSAAAPQYAELKPLFLSLALDAECAEALVTSA